MPTATQTLSIDTVLDFAATIISTPAQADRRDRAFDRAHDAGHTGCEICGKALANLEANTTLKITNSEDGEMMYFGPTCAKKMRKAGLIA